MAAKPNPEGFHAVTPYLVVDGASKLLEFVSEAFDAEEMFRMDTPEGRIGHAEVRIGDSVVMVADPPSTDRSNVMPGMLYLYVEDVDKTYRRGLEAGATSLQEPADQFYGDRTAGLQDPVGDRWWIATRVEEVSPEEMEKRVQEQTQQTP